jgi:pimeloyl-ACP methyl ester carboxylesterase
MTGGAHAGEGRNGGRPLIQVVKTVKSDEEGSAMSVIKPVFVLVHGGWHNHSAWDRVTPILEANGFGALTLDLPGAGVNAIAPTSLGVRPFDPAAFAAERSPIAGVTQEERTRAVVALVKEAALLSDGKVILVGHSAGGMTISAAAEQVPNLLLAVVYLAGFMVPNGMPLLAMLQHETMSSALGPRLFVGDPAAIGATRINAGSTDEAYRSLLKAAFYGDVSESEFAHAASQLHCDESNSGALAPSEISPGRFGAVLRHYIRCTQDCAIPLTGQDHMIATVDAAIGGKTTTHTLASSHSPFLSQPAALSKILIDICVQSLAERESAVGLDT